MLRLCQVHASHVASTSSLVHSIHTTASLQAAVQKGSLRSRQTAAQKKRESLKKKDVFERAANATRPHPVLGTKPGEENKWKRCELARILVTKQELVSSPSFLQTEVGAVELPSVLSYGISDADEDLLFDTLPALQSRQNLLAEQQQKLQADAYASAAGIAPDMLPATRRSESLRLRGASPKAAEEQYLLNQEIELAKSSQFAKLLDLRHANARGVISENLKRIMAHFSSMEKPYDPGRSEVQAAILTMRIRNMWSHLKKYRRDVGNRRHLRRMVQQRAKILRYLRGSDRQRYDALLPRLGLEPESVEGELIF